MERAEQSQQRWELPSSIAILRAKSRFPDVTKWIKPFPRFSFKQGFSPTNQKCSLILHDYTYPALFPLSRKWTQEGSCQLQRNKKEGPTPKIVRFLQRGTTPALQINPRAALVEARSSPGGPEASPLTECRRRSAALSPGTSKLEMETIQGVPNFKSREAL